MGKEEVGHEAAEQQPDHARSAEQPAQQGAGTQALHQLLAGGRPDPREVAALIAQFPGDSSAMLSTLHATLGNQFVNAVMASEQTVAPAVAPSVGDLGDLGDLGSTAEPELGNELQGVTDEAKAPAPASAKDLADADALIKLNPVGTRGPDGTAAYLIAAIDRGFVGAFDKTKKQLQQFKDNTATTIHSSEGTPWEDPKRKPGTRPNEDAGKAAALKKGIKISGTAGQYDVEIDQSSILATLVAVVHKRVERWRAKAEGKKQHVLSLGDYVRGDPGYDGSLHSTGRAIDTAFLRTYANTTEEAIALLEDLPAGPRKMVFPDGAGVHINNDGNGYGFGFGFDFFEGPSLPAAQKAAEAAEGADHTKTLEAEGLVWGRTVLGKNTATWDAKTKAWVWGAKPTDTRKSAEPFLKSDRLRATLKNLGANKP
jgi:hypothetical protein